MSHAPSPQDDASPYRPDWFCPQCGSRNDAANTQCQTCKEVGNEINTDLVEAQQPTTQDVRRKRSITPVIVLLFVISAVGVGVMGYSGYKSLRMKSLSSHAYDLHMKGEFNDAIGKYNEILSLEPRNTWALENRAAAYFAAGDYELSAKDYGVLIGLGRTTPENYSYRASALTWLGKFRAAIPDFEQARSRSPQGVQFTSAIAYCQFCIGDLDGVLGSANTLVADPDGKMIGDCMRAFVMWERGDVENAKAMIRDVIQNYPDSPHGYIWLASVLGKSNPAEADELWKQAFKHGKDYVALHSSYAKYITFIKRENADKHYENALKLPAGQLSDLEAHYLALCGLGRVAEAEKLRPRLENAATESRWLQSALATGCMMLVHKTEGEVANRYREMALDYLEKASLMGLRNWKDNTREDWILPDLKEHPRYQKLIAAP